MSLYQKLVLEGLYLILRELLKSHNRLSGTDEVMWGIEIRKAIDRKNMRDL